MCNKFKKNVNQVEKKLSLNDKIIASKSQEKKEITKISLLMMRTELLSFSKNDGVD